MKIARLILLFYGPLLSTFVAVGAADRAIQTGNWLFFILFAPVVVHYVLAILIPNQGHKLLVYYGFIVTSVMGLSGFIGARTLPEVISAILFIPLAVYFWLLVLPRREKPLEKPVVSPEPAPVLVAPEPAPKGEFDPDRRTFIKLVGSAGLAFFILSLFSNKVEDTFFGRRAITSNKTPVDADDKPVDDFNISEIDDSGPVYFGFINKSGKWYIMQESDSGSFRYANGGSNFAGNWEKRASLQYGLVNGAL